MDFFHFLGISLEISLASQLSRLRRISWGLSRRYPSQVSLHSQFILCHNQNLGKKALSMLSSICQPFFLELSMISTLCPTLTLRHYHSRLEIGRDLSGIFPCIHLQLDPIFVLAFLIFLMIFLPSGLYLVAGTLMPFALFSGWCWGSSSLKNT